ncbi:MAG: hypothetical protein AAF483_22890 [Planctomycetota bacterium]
MAKSKTHNLLAKIRDNFERDAKLLNADLAEMGLEPEKYTQSLDEPVRIKNLPTLEQGTRRLISPMLKERFAFCGRWRRFGEIWLSAEQMETVCRNRQFKRNFRIQKEEWENSAPAIIPPNRLTVYSVSSHDDGDYTYLVWPERQNGEPQLWRYQSQSETQFKNLQEFLEWQAGS